MQRLFTFLIGAMIIGMQAPADTPFYAVSYVEVAPSSKAAAVSAFKQYRDASRKEEGYVRLELFEQDDWNGHLVVIEAWASPKSFDAHMAAAPARDWRRKIDETRLSEYDQRPYKTLSLGSNPDARQDRATFVIAHVDIGGQGTNAADLLKRLAEASRKEVGNVRFDVLQHNVRANHFTVIEAWQDDKALQMHASAPHTRQYRDGLGPITGSPLDQRRYKLLD